LLLVVLDLIYAVYVYVYSQLISYSGRDGPSHFSP
jgi:hypothetical protein